MKWQECYHDKAGAKEFANWQAKKLPANPLLTCVESLRKTISPISNRNGRRLFNLYTTAQNMPGLFKKNSLLHFLVALTNLYSLPSALVNIYNSPRASLPKCKSTRLLPQSSARDLRESFIEIFHSFTRACVPCFTRARSI